MSTMQFDTILNVGVIEYFANIMAGWRIYGRLCRFAFIASRRRADGSEVPVGPPRPWRLEHVERSSREGKLVEELEKTNEMCYDRGIRHEMDISGHLEIVSDCASDKNCVLGLVKAGVISVIFSLDCYDDVEWLSRQLIEEAVRIAWKISEVDECVALAVQDGIIEHVIEACDTYMESEGIQVAAVCVLSHLARHRELRSQLAERGLITRIGMGLAKHADNGNMLHACVHTCNSICDSPEYMEALMEKEVYAPISFAMQRQRMSESSVLRGCSGLRSLATDEEVCAVLASRGALGTLNAAIQTHIESETVVPECCETLQQLAQGVDCQGMILFSGTGKVVLQAIQKNISSSDIAESGCMLLREPWQSADDKLKLMETDLNVLLEVLRERGPSSGAVSAAAVSVLHVLAQPIQAKVSLMASGAGLLILETMRAHMDDEEVVLASSRALAELSQIEANQVMLLAAGVSDLLMKAVGEHKDSMEVIQLCTQVAAQISGPDTNKEKLLADGWGALLTDLMKTCSSDSDVVESVTRAMDNLGIKKSSNAKKKTAARQTRKRARNSG
jgi:hypothetical protein